MQVPEESITPQIFKSVAPDINPQELVAKSVAANRIKGVMDTALSLAADKLGGTSSSRVKDIDTALKKIAQKRLQGREYDVSNVNDMLGMRLVVDKSKIESAKEEVKKMESAGLFKITKQQPVNEDTYHAYHIDVITPDNQKAEIQIMSHQQSAESMLNHSIRSVAGEDPPEGLQAVKEAQANIAKNLSNKKARQVSDALKQLMKMNNNDPLKPEITAAIAQQSQV